MTRAVLRFAVSLASLIAAAVTAAFVLFAPHVPIGAAVFLGCFFGFGVTCFITLVYLRIAATGKNIGQVVDIIARQIPEPVTPDDLGSRAESFEYHPRDTLGSSYDPANPFASPLAKSEQSTIRSSGARQLVGLMLYGAALLPFTLALGVAIFLIAEPDQVEPVAVVSAIGLGLLGTVLVIAGHRVRRTAGI